MTTYGIGYNFSVGFIGRKIITAVFLVLFLLISLPAHACEPIPQLMVVFFGPSLWGLTTGIGLLIVVGLKCMLFARWSGIRPGLAVKMMIIANFFSTIPGIVGAIVAMAPSLLILSPVILILLYAVPAKHLSKHFSSSKVMPVLITIAMLAATFVSIFFFEISQSELHLNNVIFYWISKIIFTTMAVSVGLAISIGYEEAIIYQRMARITGEFKSYLPAVARANVWAMLIAVALPAAAMLPARIKSPDFLVWLKNLIDSLPV